MGPLRAIHLRFVQESSLTARILIHSNYKPGNYGGIEFVATQLIGVALDRNMEVTCFFGGPSNEVSTADRFVSIQRRMLLKVKGACVLSFGNVSFFLNALKANLVLFQEPYPTLWPALLMLRLFTNKPIIVMLHADPEASRLVQSTYARLRSIVFRGTHVVASSPHLLTAAGIGKSMSSTVIPHAIPLRAGFPNTAAPARRYVLYFGRLAEYKGIEYLLEAMKVLPSIEFIVAGTGPLSPLIHDFIARNELANVVFIDEPVPEERKIQLIRGCSFLVFPSTTQNEAFGIVQLEAMREGKAIVNTNLRNGVNFVAPHDVCAVCCEPKDERALARTIELLWKDDALRSRLSSAARARFEQLFTTDRFAESWGKLFSAVTAERKAR